MQPGRSFHIHFGVFDVDVTAGQLRKHGVRVHLQDQPFQVLLALLERPGELVTREELEQRLWPGESFGDFDQGLNRAINKVRDALGDASDNPRFIETVPRRGYRFMAPVDGPAGPVELKPRAAPDRVALPVKPSRRRVRIWIASGVLLAVAVSVAAWLLMLPGPPLVKLRQITTDTEPKSWPVLSDGSRVYFVSQLNLGNSRLMQAPVSGGPATPLPFALPGIRVALRDLSPDGQELLLLADNNRVGPGPLCGLRVSDGSVRRIGAIPTRTARYAPDGSRIAWSTGEKLYVSASDGSDAREIVSLPGWLIVVVAWTVPDRIDLNCSDRKHPGAQGWQVAPDGAGLRRLRPLSDRPDCCGLTRKRVLVDEDGTLWYFPVPRWPGKAWSGKPRQLTVGTPYLYDPNETRDGRLFTLGRVRLGELQKFDSSTGSWQRHLGGISADGVEYSPDGQWVAYVRYPERSLWRCRASGNECLRLTDGRIGGYGPHWSPDGSMIAFSALERGKPWRIWLVNADGSTLRPAAPSTAGTQADPAWTADGKRLVFATGVLAGSNNPSHLAILDIESGQVSDMAGTDGLWSPKSSIDHKRLLALSTKPPTQSKLMIFDDSAGQWREAADEYAEFPQWVPGNNSIIYQNTKEIRRFRLDTWKVETITVIERRADFTGNLGAWLGQDHQGNPLALRSRDVVQVYEIEVEAK